MIVTSTRSRPLPRGCSITGIQWNSFQPNFAQILQSWTTSWDDVMDGIKSTEHQTGQLGEAACGVCIPRCRPVPVPQHCRHRSRHPRFHGILLSFLSNRPVLALSNEQKMSDLMREMGQGQFHFDIRRFTSQDLRDTLPYPRIEKRVIRASIADNAAAC